MTTWHTMVYSVFFLLGALTGCAVHLDPQPQPENLKEPVIIGQIQTWQTEPSGRMFLPEIDSFEFIEKSQGRRYRVDLETSSSFFFLSVEPGSYQVTRVFIREGGFRASAEVPLTFEVPDRGFIYVGKWRFQIGSPNFMREMEVKVSSEPAESLVALRGHYPSISLDSVVSQVAQPDVLRARLYETVPYPRFRWFNRQKPT